MEMNEGEDKYDILYLDFGDRAYVRREDILPYPSRFSSSPCHAIECSLANIVPAGKWGFALITKILFIAWVHTSRSPQEQKLSSHCVSLGNSQSIS